MLSSLPRLFIFDAIENKIFDQKLDVILPFYDKKTMQIS